eukprot:519424-Pelagomonas_calceolata.AAC.5
MYPELGSLPSPALLALIQHNMSGAPVIPASPCGTLLGTRFTGPHACLGDKEGQAGGGRQAGTPCS